MKKEFIAYWSHELIPVVPPKLGPRTQQFFGKATNTAVSAFRKNTSTGEAVIPEIDFQDLIGFSGKKTKITIEIIE